MLHSRLNCFFRVLPITNFLRSNNCCTYVRQYMQQTVWAFQSPFLRMSNCNKEMSSHHSQCECLKIMIMNLVISRVEIREIFLVSVLTTYFHDGKYIRTCMHACMHACIHTYIHTHIHTHIHTYIHTLFNLESKVAEDKLVSSSYKYDFKTTKTRNYNILIFKLLKRVIL